MRHAGDGKTFMAGAAVLMAGLVIATMLAINAKLQSALSPASGEAGAPIVNLVPPGAAPVLQNTAAPSVAKSSVAAAVAVTAPLAPSAASFVTKAPPPFVATVAKPATPAGTLISTVSSVKLPAVPAVPVTLPAALPAVATPAVVPAVITPTVVVPIPPTLAAASNTVTPDPDATDSSGDSHGKDRPDTGSTITAASARFSSKDNNGDEGDTAGTSSDGGKDSAKSDSHSGDGGHD
jgi:hypothetical protein